MFNQDPMHYLHVQARDQKCRLDGTYGAKKYLFPNHPEMSDQFADMAKTKAHQGRLAEAAELHSLAWEGRKATLGETHPLTQRSLRELAEVQKRCGLQGAAMEMLHTNGCHGYSTRHITTSRQHAATMHMLDTQLKATSRLSSLDQTLSASMHSGRSFSTGCLNETFLRKGAMEQRRRAVMQATGEYASRKGRRLNADEAEDELRRFAVVMLTKYDSVQAAFKAFDINGNGTLSGSEFCHYAKFIYDGDATAVFKALDQDRGGDITVEEFKVLGQMFKQFKSTQRLEKTQSNTTLLPSQLPQ